MRWGTSALVVACVVLGACFFRVDGVDVPSALDLGVPDLASADLAHVDVGPVDLAHFSIPDLREDLQPVDLLGKDFATRTFDLAAADLVTSTPTFPSHVAFHYLSDSSATWTIVQSTTLDTTRLTSSPALPSGVIFVADGDYAVLALQQLSVGTAGLTNVTLSVVGSRPLVIVAGAEIDVYGLIDASAHGLAQGPGASTLGNGTSASGARAGGGGGSYGVIGGLGGGDPSPATGSLYGDEALATLVGGSSGGAGALGTTHTASGCTSPAVGGGGGGALQLSARRIVIGLANAAGAGTIDVSGGGGGGGCGADATGSGGGGGGSGGALLIEGPSLSLSGRLVAAGGGGGGGGGIGGGLVPLFVLDAGNGQDGFVASFAAFCAAGGVGSRSGGAGYNGFVSAPASAKPGGFDDANGATSGGGGGGGGGGRIHVRASGAVSTASTPPATVTTDLPTTIP